MNVRVDLQETIRDGMEVVFKAPCDASVVTGLNVYYPVDGVVASQAFTFADANTNDIGHLDALFAEGAVVKVILDLDQNMAFVQNADTNKYLEHRLSTLEAMIGTGGGSIAPLIVTLTYGADKKYTSSHSPSKMYAHIQNGGNVLVRYSSGETLVPTHITMDDVKISSVYDDSLCGVMYINKDKSVSEYEYRILNEGDVLALIQENLPPNGDEVSY